MSVLVQIVLVLEILTQLYVVESGDKFEFIVNDLPAALIEFGFIKVEWLELVWGLKDERDLVVENLVPEEDA